MLSFILIPTILIIIIIIIIITDLYSAFRSEDTEALENMLFFKIATSQF